MSDNDQKSSSKGGSDVSADTQKPSVEVADSSNTRPDSGSCKPSHHPKKCDCYFELPPIIIDQPCDTQPRTYWQAADIVKGFVWIVNKGRCTMKVAVAEAGGKPPLTDTILPCQSKLFSSDSLMGFAVECCGCDPVKCLGEAKVIVKC